MNKRMMLAVVFGLLLAMAAVGLAETAVQVGDYVTLGHYEQDNDLSNGQEPIEWRVLKVEGDEAMLISRYALDAKPYNDEPAYYMKWSKCTLRQWLNQQFYDGAFDDAEKQGIVTKELVNWKDDNTEDKVFLLDNDEAKQLFSSHQDRMVTPTAYAIAQGAYQSRKYGPGNAQWWLRTHSWESNRRAAYVAGSGGVMTCGGNSDGKVENAKWTVRPAMYVRLDALQP